MVSSFNIAKGFYKYKYLNTNKKNKNQKLKASELTYF